MVFSVQTSQSLCHVMFKVAYPKFATVYNLTSSLLELLSHPPHSHLPPSQMHLLIWFFLLWPLATVFYDLGILDSFIPHWGFYKSQNTAIFYTPLANTHCKPILYSFSIRLLADPGYIPIAELNLGSSEIFTLVEGMF
jgi:hypothetical protein